MSLKILEEAMIKPFIDKLYIPATNSHKGQNGRILVIGGSSLFHASPIWSAEIASHFVDAVHFASTKENNEIFIGIKKQFRNGIVVSQKNIPDYVEEDDAILIGPGMVRNKEVKDVIVGIFQELFTIKDEAVFSTAITKYLIVRYPHKRFVLDAGALQMMKPEWLQLLKTPAIITPHQLEFERLFNIQLSSKSLEQKAEIIKETAKKYNAIILMKAVEDIISDGNTVYVIHGGNQGLTKGGTGDILAGLVTALYSKNDSITSAVLSSFILKKAAGTLEKQYGYWYNNDNLIDRIPAILSQIVRC